MNFHWKVSFLTCSAEYSQRFAFSDKKMEVRTVPHDRLDIKAKLNWPQVVTSKCLSFDSMSCLWCNEPLCHKWGKVSQCGIVIKLFLACRYSSIHLRSPQPVVFKLRVTSVFAAYSLCIWLCGGPGSAMIQSGTGSRRVEILLSSDKAQLDYNTSALWWILQTLACLPGHLMKKVSILKHKR